MSYGPSGMTALYVILDAVRAIEAKLPAAAGLAELIWRNAQGVDLTQTDRDALQTIADRLQQ
jgi:hypothetical protein